MAGRDSATARVIALILLLFAATAAIRGYLPGAAPGPRRQNPESPASLVVLVALLVTWAGVVAVAFVYRARHPRAAAGSMGELSPAVGAGRGRPSFRALLITLIAISVWALAVLLLMKLAAGQRVTLPTELPDSGERAPIGVTSPRGGPAPQSHPTPGSHGPTSAEFIVRLVAALGLLWLIYAGAAVVHAGTRRRGPRPVDVAATTPPAPTTGESLARAVELGLTHTVDPSRVPRAAIIACYAVMERHLADLPDSAPQAFDTPTEVLARAVEHHALPADNASRLVALFAEARFSPHLMTERHRAEAVTILRLVLDELRAPT